MTVYYDKRRERWTFDFEKGGKRYSGYCLDALGAPVTSRSGAVQAEGVEKRRIELAPKVARPGELTLAMATAALTPVWQTQANWKERQRWLKEIIAFFGVDSAIGSIDQARVDDYVAQSRTAKIERWIGGPKRDPHEERHARFWITSDHVRAPATTNLYLGTLRQIFARAASHRDPATGRPVFERLPTVPELGKAKRKARPMPDRVAADIIEIMPPHMVDAMMLTAFFGFRKGEVFALGRHNVDWEAQGIRLFSEDVKDDEDTFLPGSQFAMGWLWCLDMEAERRGTKRLITWQSAFKDPAARASAPAREMKSPNAAWRRARALMKEKYGRTWRWHDLRAAFITHVAIGSGPVAAQALARHSDPKTTHAYIEVADELRRMAAERVSDRPALIAMGESPRREPQTGKISASGVRLKSLK